MSMKNFIPLLFLMSFNLSAHPVIYKGGWSMSSSNMPDYSNNYVMYSLNQRLALGVEHWRLTKNEINNELGLLKLNHLLWRANGEDYQSNVYLHGGLGIEDQEFETKSTRNAWLIGAEADWETRKLYSSVKYLQFQDVYFGQMRLGFAPKEASFEELQTWFMVQGMIINNVNQELIITPMMRFFYHNSLWEIGSSTQGDWMINLMVHY